MKLPSTRMGAGSKGGFRKKVRTLAGRDFRDRLEGPRRLVKVKSREERAEEDNSGYVAWATGWEVESYTKAGRGSSLQLTDGWFGFGHAELRHIQR